MDPGLYSTVQPSNVHLFAFCCKFSWHFEQGGDVPFDFSSCVRLDDLLS